MGDRTSVRLLILASQREAAEAIMYAYGATADQDYAHGNGLWKYCFEGVNYGNLEFLDVLRDAGIAYDSSWSSGDGYGPGTESCRFTAVGEAVIKPYDNALGVPLHGCLALIDNPAALRQYILDFQESLVVLALDEDQVTHGKTYQARKLVINSGNSQ